MSYLVKKQELDRLNGLGWFGRYLAEDFFIAQMLRDKLANVIAYYTHTHTHTHTFNGPLSGTTRVSRYQKGKTNLDFT